MIESILIHWQIKVFILIFCAVMKLIGELWWHNSQRFIMPFVYSIAVSIVSGVWWLGFTTIPSIGPITLGYKDYGPSDGFDRGCWLFMIALCMSIGPALTGHLSWFALVPYCVLCGIWGGVARRWWNIIIAPISGALLGSIIFFIK